MVRDGGAVRDPRDHPRVRPRAARRRPTRSRWAAATRSPSSRSSRARSDRLDGWGSRAWLERLDADRDNLHAAIEYALAAGDAGTAQRLCGELWRYWLTRGLLGTGRRRLAARAAGGHDDPTARMRALMAAGILAGEEGDRAVARERFVEALALADETGDVFWHNRLVANLGDARAVRGRPRGGDRPLRDRAGRGRGRLGPQPDAPQPRRAPTRALGRRDRAIELLDESIEIARTVANPVHLSSTLRTLARMLLQEERESPRALALLRESLEIARDLDERPGIVECLETLAGVAARREEAVTGALLLGAAEATREAAGAVRQPDEMPWILEATTALRATLGEAAFAAAIARGRGAAHRRRGDPRPRALPLNAARPPIRTASKWS